MSEAQEGGTFHVFRDPPRGLENKVEVHRHRIVISDAAGDSFVLTHHKGAVPIKAMTDGGNVVHLYWDAVMELRNWLAGVINGGGGEAEMAQRRMLDRAKRQMLDRVKQDGGSLEPVRSDLGEPDSRAIEAPQKREWYDSDD